MEDLLSIAMSSVSVGEAYVDSSEISSKEAGKQLVQEALEDGGMQSADFGFLFTSVEFSIKKLVSSLHEEMEDINADWIGGTTAGEVSLEGSTTGGAVLLLIKSDSIDFHAVSESNVHKNPEDSGRKVAERLKDNKNEENETAVFTLISGLTMDLKGVEFEVLKGITSVLGTEVPLVGGSTGDDIRLWKTYQFHNGEVYDDGLVAALMNSDNEVVTGQEHGLKNEVATGVITDTEGKKIKEISGKPAAEWYAKAIGVEVSQLKKSMDMSLKKKLKGVARFIGMKIRSDNAFLPKKILEYTLDSSLALEMGDGNYRTIVSYDVNDENALRASTYINENQPVKVVEGDKEDIIKAGKNAFDTQNAAFGIVTDCSCRNLVMNDDELEQEVKEMREGLNTKIAGLYGMGEIGGEDMCIVNNNTVSGFLIKEE